MHPACFYVCLALQLACLIAVSLKFRRRTSAILGGLGFGALFLTTLVMRVAPDFLFAIGHLETVFLWRACADLGAYTFIFLAVVFLQTGGASSITAGRQELPLPTLKCPKCGEGSPAGATRCTSCKASLLPLPLAVLTTLALLSIPTIGFGAGMGVREEPRLALVVAWAVAGMVIVFGLRYGRFWAWIAIQVLWALDIAMTVSGAIVLEIDARRVPLVIAAVLGVAIIHILFWVYLYTPRVRQYCSGGRWSES